MAASNNRDEECSSPDIFADMFDSDMQITEFMDFDESFSPPDIKNNEKEKSQDKKETESEENSQTCWKGMSLNDLLGGSNVFHFQELGPIRPSESHTVLFHLPLPDKGVPKPYPSHPIDKWAPGFVRMPNSPQSLFSLEEKNKERELRSRWEVIQEALLQNFVSSLQLETAIFSYNPKYTENWNFAALHNFFQEMIEEDEMEMFFKHLLPKMIQLALQLPSLITGPIPLLKQHCNNSISLSQLQVASLLANAFFCTFPRRNSYKPNSEYINYPRINFNRLFGAHTLKRQDRTQSVAEKFKCIFHYFRRVTTTAPEGTITIQRRYIPPEKCPKWDQIDKNLNGLHITSEGTIEMEGAGFLQVDFANKFLGGGVLRFGCVQEEIRFVICPELMVSMLVAQVLDNTEALVISGVEQYSDYEGYSDNFKWLGDFIDTTPRDSWGRRKTTIVAIDAVCFFRSNKQFNIENIVRELNKAYVGFYSPDIQKNNLSPIATGNWGCGAFGGDPKLKILIQLMAATVAERSVVYFTFGDKNLKDTLGKMYWYLVGKNITIAQLFSMLKIYGPESKDKKTDFYKFLYNYDKFKPAIRPINTYFKVINEKESTPTSSSKGNKITSSLSKYAPLPIKVVGKSDNKMESNIEELIEEIDDEVRKNDLPEITLNNVSSNENKNLECIKSDILADTWENPMNFSDNVMEIDADNCNKNIIKKKKLSLWDVIDQNETPQDRLMPMKNDAFNIFDSVGPEETKLKTNCNTKNSFEIIKTTTSPRLHSKKTTRKTKKDLNKDSGQKKLSDYYMKKT